MTDIFRKRGDTFPIRLQVIHPQRGLPIPITAFTFKMAVNREKAPSDSSQQVMLLIGVIADADKGLVDFPMSDEQGDLQPGIYYYDTQLTDTFGRVRTFERGRYKVVQDIAK